MKTWQNFSLEELELQYNMRLPRPDYEPVVIPGWQMRSATVRSQLACQLDLAYGDGERERLDLFPTSDARQAPVLIYFHGGYWQRGDKSIYSFLAAPFVQNGVSVILVNYDLCPKVRVGDIVDQARRALAWIWLNAGQLNLPADKLHVMGHSAGGHLTAMMMATNWQSVDPRLPADLVKSGIPISGLFDLEPLLKTNINAGLSLDPEQVLAQSPMHHPPVTQAPQWVVCGEKEPSEFHRQSDAYAQAFHTADRNITRYTVPDSDHFDELDLLADTSSAFFQQALRHICS